MRKLIYSLLAFFARAIIKKYKPKIIGITGSVGKTSVKEAVFCVVSVKYKTQSSQKNFNNEIGLPLAIIGADSPGRSLLAWIKVFLKAASLLVFPHKFAEVLVLEYGIDRVGDMEYLLGIAKPDIGVITSIGLSHYEFFKDEKVIEHEKGKMAEILKEGDWLVINADNEKSMRQGLKTGSKKISYGLVNSLADVKLSQSNISYLPKTKTDGVINLNGEEIVFSLRAAGYPHLSSMLAAVAVAKCLAMEKDLIQKGIANYKPVPGRLNVINGIKKSLLIDDTYNAAPDSTIESLLFLSKTPHKTKIAVLGDMLELGEKSDESHLKIGKLVNELNLDKLITVGPGGKIIAEGARNAGFDSNRISSFDTSDEARLYVQESLVPESSILIKGSQGVRMEKITKEIMAEPMQARDLLCRQYGKWLN